MKSGRLPIVAIVLTYNEEKNLPACLRSVVSWVSRMVVVDSGSSDSTVLIGRQYGAEVLNHPFESHAKQWQWALENACDDSEWVLGLDAGRVKADVYAT
jgi:glycosyltransferase involved in cell wall biosynthesis